MQPTSLDNSDLDLEANRGPPISAVWVLDQCILFCWLIGVCVAEHHQIGHCVLAEHHQYLRKPTFKSPTFVFYCDHFHLAGCLSEPKQWQ